MSKVFGFVVVVAGAATFLVSTGRADVPAPPVNQTIGFRDTTTVNQDSAVCAGCHVGDQANRHHMLYNSALPPANMWYSKYSDPSAPDPVPYAYSPYTSRSPSSTVAAPAGRDTKFKCLSCHSATFNIPKNVAGLTDCVNCHQRSPHHAALGNPDPAFPGRDHTCGGPTGCHGSLVSNYNDGHYIPTYAPSLVTPQIKNGAGLPLNSRGKGAGSCEYCHDSDGLTPSVIGDNHSNHHNAKFGTFDCTWCHGTGHGPVAPYTLRSATDGPWCENCHGPTTLHNIQASSQTPPGPIVVGGELAGYGHVGRDNFDVTKPNGDSDCWGCHGFAGISSAPDTGPLVPTVYDTDKTTVTSGKATSVVLSGAVFTNTSDNNTVYESTVTLTAANGTSVTLTPDVIVDQGSLAVTIPAGTKPGKYSIRAKKVDFVSNPAPLSVIPKVWIGKAVAAVDKTVTITGGGFSGYQAGAGLFVNGPNSAGKLIKGTIVSWAPGKIVAKFGSVPTKVNVNAVFGKASHAVVSQ